jgi:hypothetical protein
VREAAERVGQFRAEPPWKHRRTRVALRAAGGVLIFILGFFSGSCWEKSRAPLTGRSIPGTTAPSR